MSHRRYKLTFQTVTGSTGTRTVSSYEAKQIIKRVEPRPHRAIVELHGNGILPIAKQTAFLRVIS